MTCGPEVVFLPPGARVVMREEARMMLIGEQGPELVVCGSGVAPPRGRFSSGDIAAMAQAGGAGPDALTKLALLGHPTAESYYAARRLRQPQVPCPYCGTLNPPDVTECGAGRWNGCGAPLGVQ